MISQLRTELRKLGGRRSAVESRRSIPEPFTSFHGRRLADVSKLG